MPSNPLLENNVQELLYVETFAEYSAGSGIDITNNVISLDPSVSAAIDNKLDTSSFSSYSATIDEELQYVSANAGKTYSGIAPIVVNNDTNEISADTQDISFGAGLDFTGGVLSVTAQGGDPDVETVVKTNSGYWNEVSAISSTSSVLNNQITAVRNDLNTVSTNTGYLYNDLQTTSGILSAAIDDISANIPEGFTGVNHDNNLSGDGKSIPLGLASSIKLTDPSIYTTATYGASVNVEGIMPRVQLKTNNSSYNTLGEGGMTVTHPASSVGGGYTTSHYGEKMSLSYNDGDYYLHTMDTTKSGLSVTYKGASNVKAYYNYSGVSLTNDNGATNEYVNVDSIRKWNSVYNDVSTASGGWGGGTSLTGDAQGAVDEVYSNSAIWNEITGVSSNYVSQTDLEQISGDLKSDIDYISANAITSLDGYATTSEVNTVSSYLSGQIDNKLDSTSFNPNDYYPMVGNPSGFISGVDLTDYQTKAGMTAYQPVGDYATTGDLYNTSSLLSGAIDYISGNAGTTYTGVAPIVVTGSTISADSFDLNIGSGLAFENNTLYVSAESVPEGVMVESACEYNAVNEISAYNGSAIAQYGAEKQWLQHDDTIVSISNSAQYAFGVNVSALQRLMGVDETVLWSGEMNTTAQYGRFSEKPTNFRILRTITLPDVAGQRAAQINDFDMAWNTDYNNPLFFHWQTYNIASNTYSGQTWYISGSNSALDFKLVAGIKQVNGTVTTGLTTYQGSLRKIIGIGRRS